MRRVVTLAHDQSYMSLVWISDGIEYKVVGNLEAGITEHNVLEIADSLR